MKATAMGIAPLVAVLMALCHAAAQPPAEILQALEAAQQAQHQMNAAYGTPNITAANVRRIAKASQPAEGGSGSAAGASSSADDNSALDRRSNTAPLSGVEQAMAEGVPVNLHLLMQNPAAAAQVRDMWRATSLRAAEKCRKLSMRRRQPTMKAEMCALT
jgi:hypothetical protein